MGAELAGNLYPPNYRGNVVDSMPLEAEMTIVREKHGKDSICEFPEFSVALRSINERQHI